MSRWLKLIWFAEDPWTKYHAAVGINAYVTLCGVRRSTRPILRKEMTKTPLPMLWLGCLKCFAALRHRYGTEDIVEVKVE